MKWPQGYWHLRPGPEREAARDEFLRQRDDRTNKLSRLCQHLGVPLPEGVTASRGEGSRLVISFGDRSETIQPSSMTEGVLRAYLTHLTRATQAPATSSDPVGAETTNSD